MTALKTICFHFLLQCVFIPKDVQFFDYGHCCRDSVSDFMFGVNVLCMSICIMYLRIKSRLSMNLLQSYLVYAVSNLLNVSIQSNLCACITVHVCIILYPFLVHLNLCGYKYVAILHIIHRLHVYIYIYYIHDIV